MRKEINYTNNSLKFCNEGKHGDETIAGGVYEFKGDFFFMCLAFLMELLRHLVCQQKDLVGREKFSMKLIKQEKWSRS